MNRLKKWIVFTVVCVLTLAIAVPAFAASASVSGGSVTKGDTVSVSVKFKCSDIGVAGGTLSYDASILEFKSGSGANGGGGSVKIALFASGSGESSLSTTLKFKAIGEGKSSLKLSGGSVIEFTSEESHSVSASGSVTVKAEATQEPEKTKTPDKTAAPAKTQTPDKTKVPANAAVQTKKPVKTEAPTKTPQATPSASPSPTPTVAAVTENLDGKVMTLVTDLTNVTLPEGFERGTTEYNGTPTACANLNGVILLCFTDGTDNSFYINAESGLAAYRELAEQGTHRYLFSDDAVEVPQGFAETTVDINGKTERAWAAENDEKAGFYLLYLSELGGTPEFYQYDSEKGTIQRYLARTVVEQVEVPVEVIVERTPEVQAVAASQEEADLQKLVLAAAAGVLLIVVLILMIALISKSKKLKKAASQEELMQEPASEEAPAAESEQPAEQEDAPEASEPNEQKPKKKIGRTKHTPAH